jgi:hypothetical protein
VLLRQAREELGAGQAVQLRDALGRLRTQPRRWRAGGAPASDESRESHATGRRPARARRAPVLTQSHRLTESAAQRHDVTSAAELHVTHTLIHSVTSLRVWLSLSLLL